MRTLLERVPTAAQYYRLTADSFRALCPEESGHMNMGLWPARTLRGAQEELVRHALAGAASHARVFDRAPRGILDLGSGWGGSRALFHSAFPETPYFGVNLSHEQVATARAANAAIPGTEYVVGRVEDEATVPWGRVDLLFSIEAAFHFEDKATLLRTAAAHGVRLVTLFEICVENADVTRDPLLAPSLRHAWSTAQYRDELAAAGFARVSVEDVGDRVFAGFLEHIEAIDDAEYRGRRAVLQQLRGATRALADAAARGDVRYVLLQATEGEG